MNVFLYGTLCDDGLRVAILRADPVAQPATLTDHFVFAQTDNHFPALVAKGGAVAQGLLLRDLNADAMTRLNAYEMPFGYKSYACTVKAGGQSVAAVAYFPDDVAISDEAWSLSKWNADYGAVSREMATEIGGFVPPLSGEELRAQWPQIAKRAAYRLRARRDTAPSAVRYLPKAGDVTIEERQQLSGGFFRFAPFSVSHKTFQGGRIGPLQREVLVGVDAAIVLPYDPVSDCVLLVEQLRMGPLLRDAANPWMLEPVAGMVDAGETPEAAALRESAEEAGLDDLKLEHMFSCYPTPGSSTDYFYCYAALAQLPEPTTYTGGLAEEHEDLRLHILPFDDAMTLIETGEANVGPLIAMLFWLDRNRDRLRAAA